MEALEEKKDVVRDLLMEAMEDRALIHAIQQGQRTKIPMITKFSWAE
ncbi:hypothetical protein JWG43_13810 [Desulfobulbus alkaliphilus]|nr:hypothetical protein [Desulfobulbus alkaliphilus]MBM9538152.1 hypothetical protein [Desulfobulbus alkaliphilus]